VELKPEFGFYFRELNQNRIQGFIFVEPESKKLFQISLKNWNRRFFLRGKNRPTLVKANYGRMKRSGLKWIVQKYRKRLTLTSGVCAETESVKLFQLWTDEKKWIEMDHPKVQKRLTRMVCAQRQNR
jgi:hypothetical protein